MQVLRGLEDTELDTTGRERREVFLRQWRVLAVYQRLCVVETDTCTYLPADLFTSLYTSPIYECPQNTWVSVRVVDLVHADVGTAYLAVLR